MNRIFVYLIVLFLASCQMGENQHYMLSIHLDEEPQSMAYLQDRIAGQMVSIDSAKYINGSFRFSGSLDAPEMYYVKIEGIRPLFYVFIENTEIKIHIDPENPSDYTVEGSESHDIYENLTAINTSFSEQLRLLQQDVLQAEISGDSKTAEAMREVYKRQDEERKNTLREAVSLHPQSTAAVFVAMRQLAHGLDHLQMQELLDIFDTSLNGTRYYDDLKERIEILERVAMGQNVIDFTMEDPQNQEISTQEFRGKFLLINFWASWCPYCRDENPHLVEVYEKFENSNFEILNVSLDREKDAWIKAIEADKLSWPQVSQLKGWNCEIANSYAVKSIPQNVLINPEGVIIDKNLKGKELEDKLLKLLPV